MQKIFYCAITFLAFHLTSCSSQAFNFQWARSFGGSWEESAVLMKLDKQDNIYLLVETWSNRFSIENKFYFNWLFPENRPINYVLLKYDNNGKLLWGRSLLSDVGISGNGLIIDNDNNVILSAVHYGNQLFFDTMNIDLNSKNVSRAIILKINSSGSLLDFTLFETSREITNQGGIAHDKDGNYYFTVISDRDILNKNGDTILKINLSKGRYLLVFKLDNNFNVVWIKKMYNRNGYFGDIKVDNKGNIIVYGMFSGKELSIDSFTVNNAEDNYLLGDLGESEIFLLKLTTEGKALWLKTIQGKDEEYCAYNDITFDNDNNIYLGGMFGSDTVVFNQNITHYKDRRQLNYFDVFYAKYDSQGECEWARQISNGNDVIDNMSMFYLPSRHILVSGNFSNNDFDAGIVKLNSHGRSDCFILLTNTNGEILDGTSFGSSGMEYDQQIAAHDNQLYVFANFGSKELKFNDAIFKNDTTDGSLDAILIKYSLDSLVSTNDVASKEVSIIIFPNPATTSICLQLPENFEMGLCYYNFYSITGNFIASGIMQSTNAEINLNSLPSGEYVLSGGNLKGNKFSGKFTVIR